MSTAKLIDRFRDFLDLDPRGQRKHRREMRSLLRKLKKHQRRLEAKLANNPGKEKRKRIRRDLKVVYAQRKKAVGLCRELSCKK